MTSADDALHVVVPYPASNSSVRTRAVHWIDRLQGCANRDVVFHGPGFDGSGRPPSGSAVFLLRNARRFTRGRFEEDLMHAARVGIYDLDDGLPWDDGNLPGLGHWWKRPWRRSLVAARAAAAADRMIVGNEVLADWAAGYCDDVRLVPTCIEPSEYRRRTEWAIADRVPTVGWIGSPATQGYPHDIAPSLASVHQRTGARFEFIGATAPPPEIAEFTTVLGWDATSSLDRLASLGRRHHAAARRPLRTRQVRLQTPAVRGGRAARCGSPVGVNRLLLDSMSAPAPTSAEQWTEALVEVLSADADRRSRMAAAGFELAERYSYSAWQSTWADAVEWSTP